MEMSSAPTAPETVDIAFHGVSYAMTIAASTGETLVVEIERKEDLTSWRGQFSAKYVEDITSKTGNFKKFPVFVRMLTSAARQESDSVFVDLLTYHDLELLKMRKANGHAAPGAAAAVTAAATVAAAPRPLPATATKRYLILTYAGEFDRVHYPLPLLQAEGPDPQRLTQVIQQLRKRVQQLEAPMLGENSGGGGGEVGGGSGGGGVQGGSKARKQQRHAWDEYGGDSEADAAAHVRTGGESASSGHGGSNLLKETKAACRERDLLRSRLEAAEAELEQERGLHRREMRRRSKELQELQQELQRSREQARELRARCQQLKDDLDAARRARPMGSDAQRPSARSGGSRYGAPSSAYLGSNGNGYSKYPGGARQPYGGDMSRGTSRGSSPAASRSQSPSYSRDYARPWSSGGASSRQPTSRASSAPPRPPRFDPTAYVREKQERQQLALYRTSSGGSRQSTPTRSRPGSGAATPAGGHSRPGSSGRRDASAPGSRQPSPSGRQHAQQPSAQQREAPRQALRAGSVGRRAEEGGRAASAQLQRPTRPGSRDGLDSPGRALQHVQQRLTDFAQKQHGTQPAVVASTAAPQAQQPQEPTQQAHPGPAAPIKSSTDKDVQQAVGKVYEDASSEIADIDQRLHKLQSFLKMAKASAAAP